MNTGYPQGSSADLMYRKALRTQMALTAARLTRDMPAAEVLFNDYLAEGTSLNVGTGEAWLVWAIASIYWLGRLVELAAEGTDETPIEVARQLVAEVTLEVEANA